MANHIPDSYITGGLALDEVDSSTGWSSIPSVTNLFQHVDHDMFIFVGVCVCCCPDLFQPSRRTIIYSVEIIYLSLLSLRGILRLTHLNCSWHQHTPVSSTRCLLHICHHHLKVPPTRTRTTPPIYRQTPPLRSPASYPLSVIAQTLLSL